MKKLLILFIVLAMVSSASAVPSWQIKVNDVLWTGEDVVGSDIIHAQWMADPEDIMGGCAALVIDIDHGDYVPGSAYVQDGFIMHIIDVDYPVGDGFQVDVSATGFNLPPDPVGGVFGFDFHVPYDLVDSTVINIVPISGTFNLIPPSQLPRVALHVVPEPMTIALLGLGGLFLRRRK